jgi:peptide-methionine (S)-S-oxide reductase
VIATFVGYAGGSDPGPTYRSIGDHAESFQVIYDPEVISFDDLLELFWNKHDPYSGIWLKQYMNIAFYENESQKEAIESHVRRLEESGRTVKTRVSRLDAFTLAEDYHQKHSLRRFPDFIGEIEANSPNGDWLFTYEATRLNGYLGGNGSCGILEKEIRRFGLSKGLEERLLELVCSREGRKGVACPLPRR